MKMPDSEAKKKWIKENTKVVSFKLMKKGDKDIIDFLEQRPVATTIKKSIREYMANHKDEVIE